MLRKIEYIFGKNTYKITKFIESQKEIINNFELSFILSPIVLAILGSLSGSDKIPNYKIFQHLFYIVAILSIIISIIYFQIKQKIKLDEPNALDVIEGQQALSALNNLNQEIALASTMSVFANDIIYEFKNEILTKYNNTSSQNFKLKPHVVNIINFLYETIDQTRLFGELFSISVYIYDESNDTLKDYYSFKNPVMGKEPGKGRIWPVNDNGNICIAYRNGQVTVQENNIQKSKGVFKVRTFKPKDQEYYLSAIAIPLFYKTNKNKVRALLSIASNIERRFGLEETEKEDAINKKITSIKRYSIKQIAITLEELLNTVDESNNTIFLSEI